MEEEKKKTLLGSMINIQAIRSELKVGLAADATAD